MKGVTLPGSYITIMAAISIHTPVKGVTRDLPEDRRPLPYFNPHTREGCDNGMVSTTITDGNFNPHTREGCDV